MMSIVIRKAGQFGVSPPPPEFGDVFSEDEHLVVYGPFYATEVQFKLLEALGYVYTEDFFDLAHSGGMSPDWCETLLKLRT